MSHLDSHFSLVGLFLTPEWDSTRESLTHQPLAKVTGQRLAHLGITLSVSLRAWPSALGPSVLSESEKSYRQERRGGF